MKEILLIILFLTSFILSGCNSTADYPAEIENELAVTTEQVEIGEAIVKEELEDEEVGNNLNEQSFHVIQASVEDDFTDWDVELAEAFLSEYNLEVPQGVLSIDESAKIGAQYIYEMLGYDMAEKYLQIAFYDRSSHPGQYWRGRVGDSPEAIASGKHHFEFMLDVFTGERMSIQHVWDEAVTIGAVENVINLSPEEIEGMAELAHQGAFFFPTVCSVTGMKHGTMMIGAA